jgi:hypothetical protein
MERSRGAESEMLGLRGGGGAVVSRSSLARARHEAGANERAATRDASARAREVEGPFQFRLVFAARAVVVVVVVVVAATLGVREGSRFLHARLGRFVRRFLLLARACWV